MDGRLEIGVLGDLKVTRGGEAVVLPPSRKTRALLAYLAVVDRPQRRERLCELFWDIPDDPRGALRWSLSKLRRIVDDEGRVRLDAQRDTVFLHTDGIDLDLDRVAGLDPERLEEVETSTLEDAVSAFRGGFLEDLYLSNCPEFEAWRMAHANALEILRLRLLRDLIGRLRDHPDRALPHAHALRALSPEDEDLAREVEALAAAARAAAGTARLAAPPPPPPAQADAPEEDIRFCTTRDGLRIAWAPAGAGPPLLRAGHWMSHLRYDRESPVWRHWIKALSDGHTFIRYDERCCGLSGTTEDVSFEAMVGDLEAVADAAGHDRFALLGISQGAAVAVAYAVRHPGRVSHLILYGGYVQGWRKRGNPGEIASREAMAVLMREGWGQNHPLFRQLFTSLFIPGATPEQMAWLNDLQMRTMSPADAYRLQASFGEVDVSALLDRVSVPTLVLHAREDGVAPLDQGRAFARGIAGARFVELDSANHILLAGEPAFDQFLRELRAFTGTEQPRPRAPAPMPAPAPDQSRKQVTVLALEIISPLTAFEDDDPEAALAVMDPLMAAARRAVDDAGGVVIGADPSGLTVLFGAPVAQEGHAWQACRAALAIRDAVSVQSGGSARMRAGIDTGEAVVRGSGTLAAFSGGLEVAGAPVRLARTLTGCLRRAAIAATDRARSAAGGSVRTEPLPRSECPGWSRDRPVFEVLEENRALTRWHLRAGRILTPMVGRETELQLLIRALGRARAGHGQVVGVVADPGLGKSRLTHEFLASEAVAGCILVEVGALEFDANVSHGVLRKLVRALLGIGETDPPEAARAAVSRRLSVLPGSEALLPPLLFALDQPPADAAWDTLDAGARRERMTEAVRVLLSLEARRAPVVLLVEDLHWMDPGSDAVLARLVEGLDALGVLLLVTYRPEYHPPWSGRSSFQPLRLDPLDRWETQELVRALLGDDPSVATLLTLLAERADGVPLFAEETVRTLVQDGRLEGRPSRYRALVPVTAVEVPPTVQSVIAARIDRLAEDDRHLLQAAAVVGKDVPVALLEAVADLPPDRLAAALGRLQAAEFLFETQCYPEREYTFKHAITHDVAYASLLRDRRRTIHAGVLAAMEALYAGRLTDHIEKLADHAVEAEAWDKAARYLVEAADRAIDRSAYAAAAQALEKAARALSALPETPEALRRAVDIRTRMRPALDGIGAFHAAFERLQEARALAARLEDPERLAQVLLHTSYIESTHGRLDDAIATADALKALAKAKGLERYGREADLAASQALLLRSDAKAAERRLAPHHDHFVGLRGDRFGQFGTRSVWYLGHAALAAAYLGDATRARTLSDQAATLAAETGRPFDTFFATYFRTRALLLTDARAIDIPAVEAAAAGCREHPKLIFQCWLLATLGHALLLRGDGTMTLAAAATLDAAQAAADRFHMRQFLDYASVVRACCPAAPGVDPIARRAALREALARTEAMRDRWLRVQVLRALAQALADAGQAAEAAALLDDALRTAEAAGYRLEADRCRAAMKTGAPLGVSATATSPAPGR
ncbi:hypothetical protein C882_0316 [Caenispirillum salinarum AK4]|uniref:Guanylate cyclase domain-containing protein n=1 Tax=Caenispirillum salinarum AK4 TaxID=1238182 RepID=K9GXI8_9PROT|nr:alpha/beta fold hydrolase [Caenispirillum salinarum]EKV29494.1 hypothetical protein C882_0316 [Caenispirillum salinarum AK4]